MDVDLKKNVLISGYYGDKNFGDEAILYVLVQKLKNITKNICILSSDPEFTSEVYLVNSVYKFNLFKILKQIFKSDVLISGGGSLLQDVTSLKSLLYYLFIIFVSLLFSKEVIIFAQGIGPINNKLGQFLTKKLLKQVKLITVRDVKSYELLRSWGIDSKIINDPMFGLSLPQNTPMNRVGIQLRQWKTLTSKMLNELAFAVNKNFSHKEIYIYSLQDSIDMPVCQEFAQILLNINPKIKLKLEHNLNIPEIISSFRNLDFMLSMRFHGCLLALKYGIRTCALSYDQKVEKLAEEFDIPCFNLNAKSEYNFEDIFNKLISIDKRQLFNKVNSINFNFHPIEDYLTKINKNR
ncbi:MAG: polysaccharide pyruvyl transferase CsaB [Candidatus Melainabacteria bacterium LEY3_CP_29_8]|nr:MAG: polysaccharide pyruvyl transferase CsaB [Candidatus Melainabacteria bacterium LEY3_CP_29_8]